MNNQKLAKALKKELTRNPKKTIALGLVSVVAIWFWAPLALKWSGKSKPKAKPRVVASATAQAPTPGPTTETPVASGTTAEITKLDWSALLERMSRDEQMQTAVAKPEARDPFTVTAVESERAPITTEQTPAGAPPVVVVKPEPSPAEMGLVLQGTLVSSKRARAVISGKPFGIGDKVPVKTGAADSSATTNETLEYELSEIEPARVVLTRKNKTYELILERANLAEGDQLTFGGAR